MSFPNKKSIARLIRNTKKRIRQTRDGYTGRSERRIEELKKRVAVTDRQAREIKTLKEIAAKNLDTIRELKRKSSKFERRVRELNDPTNPANPSFPAHSLIERAKDAKAVRLTAEDDATTRDFKKLVDDIFRFFRGSRNIVDHTQLLGCLVPARHGDFTRNALEQVEILLRLKDKTPARSYAYSLMDTAGLEKTGQACMVKIALAEKRVPFAHSLYLSLGDSFTLNYLPEEWIIILAVTDPQEFLKRAAEVFAAEPRSFGFEFYFSLAQQSYTHGDAVLALKILSWLETDVPDSLQDKFLNFRDSLSRAIHARITSLPVVPSSPETIRVGLLDYRNPELIKTSRNIGDHIQTLAFLGNVLEAGIRNQSAWGPNARKIVSATVPGFIPQNESPSAKILELEHVDRDFMSASGNIPKTWVIAYGWYMHAQFDHVYDFPFPPNIRPVFLSFHVNRREMLTPSAVAYLKQHGPIGCRDWSTVYLLRDHQIEAFFSGCMTMTLNKLYQNQPRSAASTKTIALVDTPAGEDEDETGIESIAQEVDAVRHTDFLSNLHQAKSLLDRYRHEFAAVRTSRLHCYLPCRAIGVPVEFVAKPGKENDVRFEGLINISREEFESTRDALQTKLAGLLDAILAGGSDEEIYQTWRGLCQTDLEKAERHCSSGKDEIRDFEGVAELAARISAGRRVLLPPSESPSTVELSLALDRNQLSVLPNVLRSIVANTRAKIRFHLLTRDLTPEDLQTAASCVEGHEMVAYPMDVTDFGAGMKNLEHITVSTMDRLILPHLLGDVDKVIYLDTDILVRGDVSRLFDLDLEGLPLAARSSLSETWKNGHHLVYRAARSLPASLAFSFRRVMHDMHGNLNFPVFNAGVLVLNLKALRKDEFCRRFLNWVEIFRLNDQDILNCYCGYRRMELPAEWNAFPTQEILGTPSLVHWAGPLKPWSPTHTLYKSEWQRYSQIPSGRAGNPEHSQGLIPLHLGKRRFFLNPESMKLEAAQQQLSIYSQPSRHLDLLRNLKADVEMQGLPADLSILSYGCSEGFECLDLRNMFPEARIAGCDINPEALSKARERCPDDITIFVSNESNLRQNGPYDVIIAFNVFCCHPETAGMDEIATLYPLHTMEAGVASLVENLRDGGILGIHNSPYFIESCASLISQLQPLPNTEETSGNGWIEKCDATGRRLCDVRFTCEGLTYSRSEWATALRSSAFKEKGIHADSEMVKYSQSPLSGSVLPGSLATTFWVKKQSVDEKKESLEFTQNWTNNFEKSLHRLFPNRIDTPFLCAEIGCFEGKGSLLMDAHLCGHPDSRLYCIDPWDDVYAKTSDLFNTPKINDMCIGQYDRFVNNTQSRPRIVPLRGISDDRIPELPDSLDFAYIDGDHSPDQVYKDAVNVLNKLRVGGIMLFDDYLFSYNGIRTGDGIDRFLAEYSDQLEVIFKDNQVAARKTGIRS